MFGKKIIMIMLGVVLAYSTIVDESTLKNKNSALHKKNHIKEEMSDKHKVNSDVNNS